MADRVGVVIVGAGIGQRMGGIDKVFSPLVDRPIVSFSLDCFHQIRQVSELVLVVERANIAKARDLIDSDYPDTNWKVCQGGETRQQSVSHGLQELGEVDWVVVHDAARPCLTVDLVNSGIESAKLSNAAAPGVRLNDTIKIIDESDVVITTLERTTLRAIQTPQVFKKQVLMEAHDQSCLIATDDAMLVESLGYQVSVFAGSYDNIKLTTPEDLVLAEAIIRKNLFRKGI